MDDTLAEDLRRAVGDLVRAARTVDTMPAGRRPSSATSTAAARTRPPNSPSCAA